MRIRTTGLTHFFKVYIGSKITIQKETACLNEVFTHNIPANLRLTQMQQKYQSTVSLIVEIQMIVIRRFQKREKHRFPPYLSVHKNG